MRPAIISPRLVGRPPGSSLRLSSHTVLSARRVPLGACATTSRRWICRTIPLAEAKRQEARQDAKGSDTIPTPEPQGLAPIDLLELYRGLVATGRLKWDDEQVRCVMKLRHLLETLEDYSPPMELLEKLSPSAPFLAQQTQVPGWWKGSGKAASEHLGLGGDGAEARKLVKVLSGEEELANLTTPRGILLTGPPGTGKSLLLSLFFQLLPIPKRRVHYHAFTLSLYRQVFLELERRRTAIPEVEEIARKDEKMDQAGKNGWRSVFANGRWDDEGKERRVWDKEEGMAFTIARNMILEYHVLYFDEFQLVDASSAALIRDVLSWYWRLGGVVVACSNRVPEDLYYHGVQRDRMAGFLDALQARCEVVTVDGGRDWRHGTGEDEGSQKMTRWFQEEDKDGFEKAWAEATQGEEVTPRKVSVYGRGVSVPAASGRACRFTFSELCEEALGPADYLTLASTFSTFFIDDVPILYLRHKNEARRLINLLDALYESRCQLYIRTPSTPATLFFPDALKLSADDVDDMTNERIMAAESLSESVSAPYRPNISLYNTSTPAQREKEKLDEQKRGTSFSVLGIWTGEDEKFAYKRAISRLVEMTTSSTYAKEDWLPLDVKLRSWETPVDQLAQSKPTKTFRNITRIDAANDDFASEAGYSRTEVKKNGSTQELRNPPKLKEQHVWGVADEWGRKLASGVKELGLSIVILDTIEGRSVDYCDAYGFDVHHASYILVPV